MKVWKIPEKQQQKWLQWLARQAQWRLAFEVIKNLTGIRPVEVNDGGKFSFVPLAGVEIPDYFTKPSATGAIRPKKNHPEGKRLLKLWKEANIPSIHPFDFWVHMDISPEGGAGVYRIDHVGGTMHLVGARGWTPEKYGYEPVEI